MGYKEKFDLTLIFHAFFFKTKSQIKTIFFLVPMASLTWCENFQFLLPLILAILFTSFVVT